MKVLLVEDDPSMRGTLERTLARRGFHLTACGDGQQALALWKSARPDVVMLDLSLPGLDGLVVLQRASSQDQHGRRAQRLGAGLGYP